MAKMIADSYKEGIKESVAQVKGFVEAREIFQLLKTIADEFTAIEFYDQWCFYRYTGRVMQ